MNLLGMLRALGDRLGVLETARAQVSRGAVKIQLRTVSLLELAGDIREDQVRLLAEKPPELCQDFDAIFRAAGIQAPAHGWTVERLKHLLQTDLFRNIERVEAQQKLSDLLRGEGVDARELVVRAVEQDRALDEFERSARERLQERARAAERRTSEIAATIEELARERSELDRRNAGDRRQLEEWLVRKRAYERDLAAAVSYLVDPTPITVDDT